MQDTQTVAAAAGAVWLQVNSTAMGDLDPEKSMEWQKKQGVVATAYTAQVQRREAIYELEVREVLADGGVSEEEKQQLKALQAKYGMSDEQVDAIARQVNAEKAEKEKAEKAKAAQG